MNNFLHWLICGGKLRFLSMADGTARDKCDRCGRIREFYYNTSSGLGTLDIGRIGGYVWLDKEEP